MTDDSTIKSCINAARKRGKKVVVDMICVSDLKKRIETVEELGADVIAVHTGVDQQRAGRTPLDDLREMRKYAKRAELAVAGGVNETTVEEYLKYKPEIIIVGNGIVKAQNPAEAAKLLGKYVHRQELI